MHTLIEVTAEDAETLEQRVTAVEKLCVSIDMIAPAVRLQKRAGVSLHAPAAGPGPVCGTEIPAQRPDKRGSGGFPLCLLRAQRPERDIPGAGPLQPLSGVPGPL